VLKEEAMGKHNRKQPEVSQIKEERYWW